MTMDPSTLTALIFTSGLLGVLAVAVAFSTIAKRGVQREEVHILARYGSLGNLIEQAPFDRHRILELSAGSSSDKIKAIKHIREVEPVSLKTAVLIRDAIIAKHRP